MGGVVARLVRSFVVLVLLCSVVAVASPVSGQTFDSGDLDVSFSGDGKVVTDIDSADLDRARAMAIQADGKIVVAGYSNGSGSYDFVVVRYTTAGVLDTTFGGGDGKVVTDIDSADTDRAYAMAIQADGKIVAAGYSNGSGNNDFVVVRYTTAGVLDTSFSGDGKVVTDIDSADNDKAYAVAIQGDGKIVVAGYSDGSGTYDFVVARYHAFSAGNTPPDPWFILAGTNEISVGWSQATSAGIDIGNYVLTAYPGHQTCSTTGFTCTITGLTTGTSYVFDITATNAIGEKTSGPMTKPVKPACNGSLSYGTTLTSGTTGAVMVPPPIVLTPNC